MRTEVRKVGKIGKNNVGSGWNCYISFNDKVITGGTLFGDSQSKLKEVIDELGEGDVIDVEFVKKGKYVNITSLNVVEKLKDVVESEIDDEDFKKASKLTVLDSILDEGALVQGACIERVKKNLGHEPKGEEIAYVNTLFIYATKELYWKNRSVDNDKY